MPRQGTHQDATWRSWAWRPPWYRKRPQCICCYCRTHSGGRCEGYFRHIPHTWLHRLKIHYYYYSKWLQFCNIRVVFHYADEHLNTNGHILVPLVVKKHQAWGKEWCSIGLLPKRFRMSTTRSLHGCSFARCKRLLHKWNFSLYGGIQLYGGGGLLLLHQYWMW